MATPFATFADLEDRWRTLSTEERARADVLLASASRKVRARKPDIDALIAAGDVDEDLVVDVVCSMVKRVMQGPTDLDGVTQSQQTAGPFSQGVTFANPSGDLYLTKSEMVDLGLRGQRASSVDLIPDDSSSSDESSSSSSSSSSS